MKKIIIFMFVMPVLAGCTSLGFLKPSPYELGESAVDMYMIAESQNEEKIAEGMELGYEALLQILEGPEREMPADWNKFLGDIAEEKGFNPEVVKYAEGAVDRIRGRLRNYVSEDKDIVGAYKILEEFNEGIEDRLEYWTDK